MIDAFFEGCRDEWFWKWVTVTQKEIWSEAESDRHWGMICTCPNHVADRARGVKHIVCPYNGRRLDGAFDHVVEACDKRRTRSRYLTEADCENDRRLFKLTKQMLTQLAAKSHQRFKYLGIPPGVTPGRGLLRVLKTSWMRSGQGPWKNTITSPVPSTSNS